MGEFNRMMGPLASSTYCWPRDKPSQIQSASVFLK